MTGIQAIGVLMIRLWAAVVIIGQFLSSISTLFLASAGGSDESFVAFFLASFLWSLAAIAAWLLAPRLSRAFVPEAAPDNLKIIMGVEDFVAAGSFLIGGFFLVRTAPDLVTALVDILGSFLTRETDAPPANIGYQWRELGSAVLIFAIALFLTFRPREIAKMFGSLQQAGLSKVDQTD